MDRLTPFVSVIIPCRDEARHIASCLESILATTYPPDRLEVIVVDGMSTDGTMDVLESFAKRSPAVRVVRNERRITPVAMNLGILASRGDIIIRMDAHAEYPTAFIPSSVSHLLATGAAVVGGPIETKPGNDRIIGVSIALLLSHRFGVGNSAFRTSGTAQYVDTVPFGAYRRNTFEQVGLFNEALVRNQDNELCSRVLSAGGRIYMAPDLKARYFCPEDVSSLVRQAFRTGMWNVATLRFNGRAFRWRHFIPGVFVLAVLAALPAAAALGLPLILSALPLALHALAGTAVAAGVASKRGFIYALTLPWLFMVYHLSYGFGIIVGSARTLLTGWPVRRGAALKTVPVRSAGPPA